jgi:serine/threonine protein kinase
MAFSLRGLVGVFSPGFQMPAAPSVAKQAFSTALHGGIGVDLSDTSLADRKKFFAQLPQGHEFIRRVLEEMPQPVAHLMARETHDFAFPDWVTVIYSKASQSSPTIIGKKSRYKLSQLIARGGGQTDTHIGQELKTLKPIIIKSKHSAQPELLEQRLRTEKDIFDLFDHPNILKIGELIFLRNSSGLEEGVLVSEPIEKGWTLTEWIQDQSRRRLSERELIQLGAQFVSALKSIHGAGIIHRDLNPDNIFLMEKEDGSLVSKIMDFGIASMRWGQERLFLRGELSSYYALSVASEEAKQRPVIKEDDYRTVGLLLIDLAMKELRTAPLDNDPPAKRIRLLRENFIRERGGHLSDEFIDILEKMVDSRPKERITAVKDLCTLVEMKERKIKKILSPYAMSSEYMDAFFSPPRGLRRRQFLIYDLNLGALRKPQRMEKGARIVPVDAADQLKGFHGHIFLNGVHVQECRMQIGHTKEWPSLEAYELEVFVVFDDQPLKLIFSSYDKKEVIEMQRKLKGQSYIHLVGFKEKRGVFHLVAAGPAFKRDDLRILPS